MIQKFLKLGLAVESPRHSPEKNVMSDLNRYVVFEPLRDKYCPHLVNRTERK